MMELLVTSVVLKCFAFNAKHRLLVLVTAATGCLTTGDSGNAMQLLMKSQNDSKQALLQPMLTHIITHFICNDSIGCTFKWQSIQRW